MVSPAPSATVVVAMAAAADQEAIPPDARATALMAYLGLVLLGIFFVVAVVIAARWIRRQVRDTDD